MSNSTKDKTNRQKDRFIRAPQSYTASALPKRKFGSFLNGSHDTKIDVREGESSRIIYKRNIAKKPIAILEVMNLSADFYLNLIDWKNSLLGICLGNGLYFYNVSDKRITPWARKGEIPGLVEEDALISSFQFSKQGNLIYVGATSGSLKVFSLQEEQTEFINIPLSAGSRIAVLDSRLDGLVGCGNKSGLLTLIRPTEQANVVAEIQAHNMEICSLKWHPTSEFIVSTGGNDNSVLVWDIRQLNEPIYRNDDFKGAVRAMDWCPWNPAVLAVGGGSSDRTLRTIKYQEGTTESIVDTGSQVCAAHFYPAYHEIITAHGFIANDIGIWKYPGLQSIDRIASFNNRILQSAINLDLGLIAAGCPGDQLVKIWSLESKVKETFEEGKKLR